MFDMITDDPYLKFFGLFYLVAAASLMITPKSWHVLIERIAEDRGTCLLMGLITLMFSLVILVIHDDWESSTGHLILSIIGVLVFIKSLFYLLAPGIMQKMAGCSCMRSYLWFYGFIAASIGIILLGI